MTRRSAPRVARSICMRLCFFGIGDLLAKQDVTQKRLYLVMEGELDVMKNGVQIATAHAGEFTGEVTPLIGGSNDESVSSMCSIG